MTGYRAAGPLRQLLETIASAELPPTPPRGPDEHARVAGLLGLRSVKDLLVLSRPNDPYFKGTPAHWRDARWFAELWEHFGFARGFHLRRVHYRAMTESYSKLDGTGYANTEQDWKYLGSAGTAARILRLVDAEAFDDRRNRPPIRNVKPRQWPANPEVLWDLPGEEYLREDVDDLRWTVPSLNPDMLTWQQAGYRLPRPVASGYDYTADDQSTLVEVWIEKSTMNDVLVPVCRGLNVNLIAGTGFQSITAAISLLRRAEQHDKPAHIIYISDFDPAGVIMPVAIARQVQFWADELGIDGALTLHPNALTREQVEEYSLPRAPVRLDKNGQPDRRGRNFEAAHGEGVVELDALEALHPGELAAVVRQAVQPYIDQDLERRLLRTQADAQQVVSDTWEQATTEFRGELRQVTDDISAVTATYRDRLVALARELRQDLAPPSGPARRPGRAGHRHRRRPGRRPARPSRPRPAGCPPGSAAVRLDPALVAAAPALQGGAERYSGVDAMTELRHAALGLADRGKPVFPCRPNGKEPLTPHGFEDATIDRPVVLAWWGRWPTANIGMPTGHASGFLILDIDPRHDGMRTLAKLCAHGAGLDTLEVETGGGGLHLYLTLPAGIDLPSSNAAIKARFGPGVDVKARGGYVIVPPSQHPSGGRYRWGPGELRPVPAWLIELLATPAPGPAAAPLAKVLPFDGHDRRQLVRLNRLLERVQQATEGERNNVVFWASCRLAELLADEALEDWTVHLEDAAVAAGLTTDEARRTIASGLRRAAP